MAKFVINPRVKEKKREVEADYFATNGDFIDFYKGGSGVQHVVLRVKSDIVTVIERIEE